MAGINHVIGIENGRGYYIRGNVEIDVEVLKEQDVENDGNLCAVCAGKSNGIHFGSASCAACNAFFRRSVVENRKYICNGNANCQIFKDGTTSKCICRACRLLKCLTVGMQPQAVQPHRDTIGKKPPPKPFKSKISTSKQPSFKTLSIKSADSSPKNPSTSNIQFKSAKMERSPDILDYECLPNTSSSNHEQMSNSWSSTDDALEMDDLIEQGLKAYARLAERRRLVYGCRSVEKLIDGTEPEYKLWAGVDHYRLNDSMAIPTANLVEFLKSFAGFCSLSTKDQITLFRHFGAPFIIFEKYYITYKQGGLETKRIYRQDYTYVQLEMDYKSNSPKSEWNFIPPNIKKSDGQLLDDETLTKLATPYIIKALELIVKPMVELNFTDVEFIGSILSMLFDPNLPSLTQEGRDQVKCLRDKLYLDWFNYYTESDSEAALRMGNSLLLTPILDNFVRHYKEFFHLLRVFGILEYDKILDDFFFDQ